MSIHLIETGHSLLREVPGVEVIDYEVCDIIQESFLIHKL